MVCQLRYFAAYIGLHFRICQGPHLIDDRMGRQAVRSHIFNHPGICQCAVDNFRADPARLFAGELAARHCLVHRAARGHISTVPKVGYRFLRALLAEFVVTPQRGSCLGRQACGGELASGPVRDHPCRPRTWRQLQIVGTDAAIAVRVAVVNRYFLGRIAQLGVHVRRDRHLSFVERCAGMSDRVRIRVVYGDMFGRLAALTLNDILAGCVVVVGWIRAVEPFFLAELLEVVKAIMERRRS
jgi:hypothetical protein